VCEYDNQTDLYALFDLFKLTLANNNSPFCGGNASHRTNEKKEEEEEALIN
jgi:hypothetical protein